MNGYLSWNWHFWTIQKIPILRVFQSKSQNDWTQHSRSYWYAKKEPAKRKHRIKNARFFFFGGWKENREAMFAFRDTRCGTKKGGHVSIDRFPLPTPSGIRKRGLLRLAFPRLEIFFRDRMIMQNRGRLMCCEGNWKYDRYDRLSLFGPKLKILQDLIYVKSKLGRKRFQHEIWLFGFLVQEIYPRRFQG